MKCPGLEKCLKCDVKPVDCVTIYNAQWKSVYEVLEGKLKPDESRADMARRFPGKAGRGPYDNPAIGKEE